jgi:acyl-homoserine lactone acylase PvdQ
MNPGAIASELERLMDLLWGETEQLAALAERAASAEVDYRACKAKAYLAAQGTVPEREAHATLESQDELLAHRLAEGLYHAQREKVASIRAQIEALRTLNANMRV